jgi:hypothetical protein
MQPTGAMRVARRKQTADVKPALHHERSAKIRRNKSLKIKELRFIKFCHQFAIVISSDQNSYLHLYLSTSIISGILKHSILRANYV